MKTPLGFESGMHHQVMRLTRCLCPFVMATLVAVTTANAGDDSFAPLHGSVLPVQPGGTTTLRLRAEAAFPFQAAKSLGYFGRGEYVLIGAPAHGCAPLDLSTEFTWMPFDPTNAGGDLLCLYTIERRADSIHDLSIQFVAYNASGTGFAGPKLVLGTTADPTLTVQQESFELLPDGRARGLVRVDVGNPTDISLSGLNAGRCLDDVFPEFQINGDIPDGCGSEGGGTCFITGYGFAFAPIAAHSIHSCRVELTSYSTYDHPMALSIGLYLEYMKNAQTGGSVLPTQEPATSMLVLAADHLFTSGFE